MLRLRVMTWNILHAAPCEEEKEHPWRQRRDAARAVVDRIKPDILCLQEAFPAQTDHLLGNLPTHWALGKDRHGGNEDEGCPIAFDTARFKLLDWEQFWLGGEPDEPSLTWVNDVPRILTRGHFEDYDTGQRFHVANTHMDHLVPTSRTKSIKLLQERLPEGTPQEPLILVGDFNSPSWSKPHRSLMNGPRRFYDTYKTAERGARLLAGTFHHFTGKGFLRPDWILTRPRVETESIDIRKDQPQGVYPSDHFPLVADLILRASVQERSPVRPIEA